jgi:hypothetical protein
LLAFAEPPAFDEPPATVDDGLLLHAVATRARATMAMMAAAVRAAGGRARRGGRTTRVPSFIGGIGFMPAVLRPGG